jgi:hypothetical protein
MENALTIRKDIGKLIKKIKMNNMEKINKINSYKKL